MLASDADRDRVVQALQEAYVQGRLNHDELDQRLDLAIRSRTTDDLQSLLDDLRPRPAPAPAVQSAAPPPHQQDGLTAYLNWWPAAAIGIVVLSLAAGPHNSDYVWWWIVFPAFFWLRGGRRRHRHRRY